MRYWNDGYIHASTNLAIIPGVSTKEKCMDLCLKHPECVTFIHHLFLRMCHLRPYPGSTTFLSAGSKSRSYVAGVRCDRSLPAKNPADGAYPPAGKTLFILPYIVQKRGPLQNNGLLLRIQDCQYENPFCFR